MVVYGIFEVCCIRLCLVVFFFFFRIISRVFLYKILRALVNYLFIDLVCPDPSHVFLALNYIII
jgi:hypothetical protein